MNFEVFFISTSVKKKSEDKTLRAITNDPLTQIRFIIFEQLLNLRVTRVVHFLITNFDLHVIFNIYQLYFADYFCFGNSHQ